MKTAEYLLFVCLLAIVESGCCRPPERSTISGIQVVNIIPKSQSNETNQDSEPFLAVNPRAPDTMAASAFTPNPFGTSGDAPIYVSIDNGATWYLNCIVPSHAPLGTYDITLASTKKDSSRLYAGIIRDAYSLIVDILRTHDFTLPTVMAVLEEHSDGDQPFVQAATFGRKDRIFVGNNDFSAAGGRTATVAVSLDDGATFNAVRIETRTTAGQNGPSVRPAISGDSTVYAAYFGWRSFSASIATSDVVVVRDDLGARVPNPFRDLTDPSDGQPGRIVAHNVSIPWSNAPTLGFERIGSTLSLAVHPTNSSIVYVAWADRVGDGDIYTIHLRRSTDRGVTWSSDVRTIRDATCCAVAIAGNGTVGFLYQRYLKTTLIPPCGSQWVTHLEESNDGFLSWDDVVLAHVPGSSPAWQFLPYLGDYNFLVCVGDEFRGIFSANNTPDLDNFPNGVTYQRNADFGTKKLYDDSGNPVSISIDPFYFSVKVK